MAILYRELRHLQGGAAIGVGHYVGNDLFVLKVFARMGKVEDVGVVALHQHIGVATNGTVVGALTGTIKNVLLAYLVFAIL